MTTPSAMRPPPPAQRHRWWTSRWFIGAAVLVVGIAIWSGASADNTPTPTASIGATTGPTVTKTKTTKSAKPTPSTSTTTKPTRPAKPKPTKHRDPIPGTVHGPGVPASAMPIARLTPGDVLTTSTAKICVTGYSSTVRDVPDSEKEAAYARYGVQHVPYAHEVDHLISLELGGSNDITNLWPEPYAGRWGARTKDVLENKLHDLVCSGALTLPYAQHIEGTNWAAAYRTYVGTPAPATPTTQAPATTQSAPTGGSGCAPGYSPCLPIVGDLNCSDIPSDKTPVQVTGSDPYGLDADGDGWGCTS
jgi:hypothetical protein